ncbi:MAG: hypothetical protein KUG77_26505 [Nannocystaceae bacterium]|nr:hypothetical protein [Nannocystaceae bacterium]
MRKASARRKKRGTTAQTIRFDFDKHGAQAAFVDVRDESTCDASDLIAASRSGAGTPSTTSESARSARASVACVSRDARCLWALPFVRSAVVNTSQRSLSPRTLAVVGLALIAGCTNTETITPFGSGSGATALTTASASGTDSGGTGDTAQTDSQGTSPSGSTSDSGVESSSSGAHADSTSAGSTSVADTDEPSGDATTATTTGDPTGAADNCSSIDLLFIVDNSSSMEPFQTALAQAFPGFADAIVDALPSGVNIHVGVTSTEMGFSFMGSNEYSYVNGDAVSCVALGDGDAPAASFYQTPDVDSSGTNGAQGRLYVAGGMPYYDFNTDDPPAVIDDLSTWFSQAAQIGAFGSQVEMSAAAAAWATDPVNSAVNDGFLRDDGSVLVLFFIQDEHDQTPIGEAATLVQKIADAKTECGGFDCVVGGGFVMEDCLPLTPLGAIFDAIGPGAITEVLPAAGAPVGPEIFEDTLRDTLTDIIADTCDVVLPS